MEKGKRIKQASVFFGAVLAGLLAVSCGGSGGKDAEGFPAGETLAADSIAIEQVLSVSGWNLYGDYAVIFSPQTEKTLFRYRLPDWTFVDTTFSLGEGPDDFGQYVSLLGGNDPRSSAFWIGDVIKGRMARIAAQDGGVLGKTVRGRYVVGQQSAVFGDTLVAYSTQEGEREAHIRTAVLADMLAPLDSVPGCSQRKIDIKQANGQIESVRVLTYNAGQMIGAADRLAVWYPGTKNLAVYRIGTGGRLSEEGVYGEAPLTQEAVDAYVEAHPDFAPDDFSLIAADREHLYFLEKEREKPQQALPEGTYPPVKSVAIKVYDWQFRPVAKLLPDHPSASDVRIDLLRRKIYAYDPQVDFEQVYVYEYEL